MKKIFLTLSLLFTITLTACGNSQFTAEGPSSSSSASKTFSLGSDFPADILIPNIDGMTSTAFVVSTTSPAGVLAIDLDAPQLQLSSDFAGMLSPSGTGIPHEVFISSTELGFLLTSTHLVAFNPHTGEIYAATFLLNNITIGSGQKKSNGTNASSVLTPNIPEGMERVGDKVFITFANYDRTSFPAIANPGIIGVFSLNDDYSVSYEKHFISTCYNPTAITKRNDQELVVTNSGVITISNGQGNALTESCLDIINTDTEQKDGTVFLGILAASFHKITFTFDGSRGFFGSAEFGHVYEVDFINRLVLHGKGNPYVITDDSDFITDVDISNDNATLFVSSFEESTVYMINLANVTPQISEKYFQLGFPAGVSDENPSGANTGVGPLSVRHGVIDEDYTGADIVSLTAYPGQVISFESGAAAEFDVSNSGNPNDNPTPLPEPPSGNSGEACQGFAQAVASFFPGSGAGFGNSGFPDIVLGEPRGLGDTQGSLHVLSLGTNGKIVLDLGNCPVVDGDGDDFIIFENAFNILGNPANPYAELATVAVSNDGVNFVSFPCHSSEAPYTGCAGWKPVYSHIENDIDPFDLENAGGESFDLNDIGIAKARYIRIIDKGNNFGGTGTKGFDLDAIAVVNGVITN